MWGVCDTKVEGENPNEAAPLRYPNSSRPPCQLLDRRSSAFCGAYLVLILALGKEENVLAADERRSTPIKQRR
jgi:hypothetical protein